jgi:hypothetical protein
VISQLLLSLPPEHEYRIIFTQRPLAEVLASQEQMLHHRGSSADGASAAAMTKAFQNHLFEVNTWLNGKSNVKTIRVPYHNVLREPKAVAEDLAQFLDMPLNVQAMSQQVDATLYRQRSKAG